jgi:phage major head subunit gpT-like protein
MDPTPAALQILFTGINVSFYEGYAATPTWADQVAMTVPSDTELETYGWMDRIPAMREWIGPREVVVPNAQSRSLVNKHWELSIGLDANKFRDDKYGLYMPLIREQARQAAKQHDYQLQSLIESNPTGFDGQSFFSTAHPTDTTGQLSSATQSNDLTTLALTPSNFGTAKSAMRSFVGRDGKPFGEIPTLLVVPTALEEAAVVLQTADFFSPQTFANMATNVGNVKNIYKGTFEILVVPELTHPKIWYVLSNAGYVKPFLKQIRQPINMVPLVSPTDPNVVWMRQYNWLADMRSAYDVTLWWKAIRCGASL